MAPWMLLMLAALVRSQETTPDYTVTYNPGQDCLPYDGSVVPDCSKFVDPITKQPYYHEHSFSNSGNEHRTINLVPFVQIAADSGSVDPTWRLVCLSAPTVRKKWTPTPSVRAGGLWCST